MGPGTRSTSEKSRKMERSPIALFAYNRPFHLNRTIDSLSHNSLAKESELFIFCDGPRVNASEEELQSLHNVREIAHAASGFKHVMIFEQESNIGLAASIIGGVTNLVQLYGKVIVLEDDLETSPGFLSFMNDALEMYHDDERVMHVTGYMFPTSKKTPDTFFYEVPHCWGWATWERAWRMFSNDTDELYSYWCSRWKVFNKWGGTSLQEQLTRNYEGTLNTWFVKWHAAVLRNNGLTLYPGRSLVRNNGLDGTGENCIVQNTSVSEIVLPDYVRVNRISLHEDTRMARIIRVINSGHWYSKRYRRRLLSSIRQLFGI